jgi:hypothetical protein
MIPVRAAMVVAGVPREAAIGTIGNNAKAETKRPIPSLKRHPFAVVASPLMSEKVMIPAQVILQFGCPDDEAFTEGEYLIDRWGYTQLNDRSGLYATD